MYKTASNNLQGNNGTAFAKPHFKSMAELVCETKKLDFYEFICSFQTMIDETIANEKSPPIAVLESYVVEKGKYKGLDLRAYYIEQRQSFLWYWMFFADDKENFRHMLWFLVHCHNGYPILQDNGEVAFKLLTEDLQKANEVSGKYVPLPHVEPSKPKIEALAGEVSETIARFNSRQKKKRRKF